MIMVCCVLLLSSVCAFLGDSDEEGELLAGIMSPPHGYSSADEALPYTTSQQTASIQVAVARHPHLHACLTRDQCQTASARA